MPVGSSPGSLEGQVRFAGGTAGAAGGTAALRAPGASEALGQAYQQQRRGQRGGAHLAPADYRGALACSRSTHWTRLHTRPQPAQSLPRAPRAGARQGSPSTCAAGAQGSRRPQRPGCLELAPGGHQPPGEGSVPPMATDSPLPGAKGLLCMPSPGSSGHVA